MSDQRRAQNGDPIIGVRFFGESDGHEERLLARIDKYATVRGLSRAGAIKALADKGLEIVEAEDRTLLT